MRILRVRSGFQADHSSSSYLFYAVDKPVSAAGQAIANRYSSSAEVDEQYARYTKWGERELDPEAFEALLDEHYDVMVEESYGWWTLMIAVSKTPEMKGALAAFRDARGDNDLGLDIQEYGKRMAVTIYCQFEGDGVEFLEGDFYDSDIHQILVELLAKVRAELLEGNTSFLSAVGEFYHGFDEDEDDEEDVDESGDDRDELSSESLDDMSKAELQEACERRGIDCKKSWTKSQLREALEAARTARRRGKSGKGRPKLSREARTIVGQLVSL
jgi:hypothetical protein